LTALQIGMGHSVRKIIWALDPYVNNEGNKSPIVPLLTALTSPGDAVILPVAVIAPEGNVTTLPPFEVGISGELRLLLRRRLEDYLSSTGLAALSMPVWLDEERHSIASRVETLMVYAREVGASLIAVGTHGHKGLERALLGSFAETLLLHADIPTVSVGPFSRRVDKVETIFFASDFSQKAYWALMEVLPLVRCLKARLLLFHYNDLFSGAYFPLDPGPKYLAAVEQRELWEQEQGMRLVAQLKEDGIDAELLVARENVQISAAILHFAAMLDSAIIAMASQTGRFGSVFLGSVTRQVMRSAPCPVWVIHPNFRRSSARRPAVGATR